MNKRAEVQEYTFMFWIKLVFAVALILLIFWLFSGLWGALFGTDNKTEKDNFETLFNLIASKQRSSDEYDSSKLTVYIETGSLFTSDHNIFFFAGNDRIECAGDHPIYRPTDCKTGTSCLCLYDSDPDKGEDEKDDDVIMCKQFNTLFNIEKNDFQMINFDNKCNRNFKGDYANLIVGVHNYDNKRRVFVWLNNESNRKLDEQFKKNICPETTGLCKGKRDGDITNVFNEVNIECSQQDPKKAYFEAKCTLEGNKCKVECKGVDCAQLTCEQRNIDKDFYVVNSKEEYFCQNKFCAVACENYQINQYSCISGKETECKGLLDNSLVPGIMENCKVIMGPYSDFNPSKKDYHDFKVYQAGDIIGFDDSNNTLPINCKSKIEEYFQRFETLVCIPGKECNEFVKKNTAPPKEIQEIIDKCELTTIKIGEKIFITKHNSCTEINDYFTSAYRCNTKNVINSQGSFGNTGLTP